jgi:hypothetical protein
MNPENNRDILPFKIPKSVDLGDLSLTSAATLSRRPQLTVEDLRVLVLPAPGSNNKVQPWDGMKEIFAPETCARHILVCTPEQFSRVPENALSVASQRRGNLAGAEAYQFLVEFACGLHSHDVGEYHVVSQLKDELQRYNRSSNTDLPSNQLDDQTRSMSVSRLISFILADQKAIREELINFLPKDITNRQKFSMVLAKQAAQITGGEDILVIANSSAGSGEFENLAHVLGRDNTHTVSQIRVTHPNSDVLRERIADLRLLRRDKKISCEIESVPFTNIVPVMQIVDHVFCLLPMSPSGAPLSLPSCQIDNMLRLGWRLREREDGFFVHVKGDPTNHGASSAEWQIDAPWFISPESLKVRYAEARNLQNGILSCARTAAQNCALSRFLGERPPFGTKLKEQPGTSVVCGLTHSAYANLYGQAA